MEKSVRPIQVKFDQVHSLYFMMPGRERKWRRPIQVKTNLGRGQVLYVMLSIRGPPVRPCPEPAADDAKPD